MKHYTPEELVEVLIAHKKWANSEDGGKRADLRGADLSGADLSGADLSGADLSGADLSGAYLSGVKIKTTTVITGLYKYLVMPVIAVDGTEHILLGCHFRSTKDWADNFWNNPSEFPNIGDTASKDRWNAYQTCLRWLEIYRDPTPSDGE